MLLGWFTIIIINRIKIRRLNYFVVLFLFCGLSSADDQLQFLNAWVQQAPPSSKVLAAYGDLKNISDKNIRVVSISSDFFEKIEVHVTTLHEGMMHMEKQLQLMVKMNETLIFKPGSRHLMLIKPKKPIKRGALIPFKLEIESGEIFSFSLPVKR